MPTGNKREERLFIFYSLIAAAYFGSCVITAEALYHSKQPRRGIVASAFPADFVKSG